MIVVVGGQKGGSGKSTVAINLAVQAVAASTDLLLIDADPQGTMSDWVNLRIKNGHSHITCVQRRGAALGQDLVELNAKYEMVIVDCDGRSSESQIAAMSVADKMFIIVQPSTPDIWTLAVMKQLHDAIKPINPKLNVSVVFNMVSTNANDSDFRDAVESVKEFYPEFNVFPYPIKSRKGFKNAFAMGLGISEMKDSADSVQSGALEIRRLSKNISSINKA
jgi:chromosome partitioning protein